MGGSLPEGSEEDEQAIGSSGDRTPYRGMEERGTSPGTATGYIGLISKYEVRYPMGSPLREQEC